MTYKVGIFNTFHFYFAVVSDELSHHFLKTKQNKNISFKHMSILPIWMSVHHMHG